MKLSIVISKKVDNSHPIIHYFIEKCKEHAFDYEICQSTDPKGDILVLFGGDGTVLTHSKLYNLPVLAVNMGKVGFLSQIAPNQKDIDTKLSLLKQGKYTYRNRTMLEVKNGQTTYIALNDAVFAGIDRSENVEFCVRLNGEGSQRYTGDGVIVSTPTGSTAYCLAAGGPAVENSSQVFLMVPLACNAPSIVFNDNMPVEINPISGRFVLHVDGVICQYDGGSVFINKSKIIKKFIKFEEDYFAKIHKKLTSDFGPSD
jgi:NAD+ kinase